ncbi:hypothetical protein AVEN_83235-1 [Araneus ventricosus]|uniref:Uncharacterized protein n=1 Tax=Araneus ventricosus TaxID=182803 RepID=A0A4Y2TR02_ARAVE|nr:hypothetical protein AVEN_83235-1 [Araneus ventricosus]
MYCYSVARQRLNCPPTVVVLKFGEGCQLRCRTRHLTPIQNYEIMAQKKVLIFSNLRSLDSKEKQPYSPDLAPCDFHLFGPLKQHLGGKHCGDDDDVQHEVLLWMREQLK